ncbi:MAG: hypothetical protein H7Y20_16200, partial [Bryobacteraceae bacterium]|nr:hypothetical protein [Bryobacteraceae bacterium]
MRTLQSSTALLLSALMILPAGAFAETADRLGGTSDPSAWHSRFTRKYSPAEVPPISLRNSSRLDALLRAGRLYLSLQDAVALALENNLDIEIQRYGPQIAESDLLRAQAGGVVRGVPTSVTQGPSSAANLQTGGSGGAQGGGGATTAGGSATNNATVLFTGTNVPNYDESVFMTYTWGHRTATQANSFSTGIPALVFNNSQLSGGVQKGFGTGGVVQLGYTQSTQNSNNLVSEINPFTNANLNLQVTQPLLRGFGMAVNNRFIRVARNQLKISD